MSYKADGLLPQMFGNDLFADLAHWYSDLHGWKRTWEKGVQRTMNLFTDLATEHKEKSELKLQSICLLRYHTVF